MRTAEPEGGALPAMALSAGVWGAGAGSKRELGCGVRRRGGAAMPGGPFGCSRAALLEPGGARTVPAGGSGVGWSRNSARGAERERELKVRKKGTVWVRDEEVLRCGAARLMQVPGTLLRAVGWSLRSGFPLGRCHTGGFQSHAVLLYGLQCSPSLPGILQDSRFTSSGLRSVFNITVAARRMLTILFKF